MLKFNVNKVLFLMLFAATVSCSTADDVTQKQETTEDLSRFEGIDKITVDGKEVSDRKITLNAELTAWNVHYDYPNKQIDISSTAIEYEKYIEKNPVYKKTLMDMDKRLNEVTKPENDTQLINAKPAIGMHGGKFNALNYPGTLVWHHQQSSKHYIFPVKSMQYFSSPMSVRYVNHQGNLATDSDFIMDNKKGSADMFGDNASKTYIVSTTDLQSRAFVLYNGTYYTGMSKTISILAKQRLRLDRYRFYSPYTPGLVVQTGSIKF
jgi:hypothetical protein